MRVLITGGTGFIGSHTAAAVLGAGHEVRLLVRSPDRIQRALSPLGVEGPVDSVAGDITDLESVERAVDGCDAVIHAAAIFDLDARAAPATRDTNAPGARNVLKTAVAAGCDPIVHVSSTTALLRPQATVRPTDPLSTVTSPYVLSKVESERIARHLQEDGAPVTIVQPGGTYGPHDPKLSDQMRRLRDVLRGLYPMWPRGGFHAVDVRDDARVLAATLEPGQGPRTFAVPGHHLDGELLFGTLRRLTGRRLPMVELPATVLAPITTAASLIQRVVPFHLPAEHEGLVVTRTDTRIDTSETTARFGIVATPFDRTVEDAVRWLHEAGHLSARQVGKLAD